MLQALGRRIQRTETGMLEETIFVISSLSGLQEPEPNWLLPNGVVVPNSGKYLNLYNFLGTRYGSAGQLPNLVSGFKPIPQGASQYPTIGATDGAVSVALSLNHCTPHTHPYANQSISVYVGGGGWMDYSDPFGDGGGDVHNNYFTDVQGGGGAHNNMPPGIVVEGFLVAL
jgi:microcystin-dependent protein